MKDAKEPMEATRSIVMPAVSPAEAKAAWEQYELLKQAIIKPEDIQKIEGRDFLKKSYWRKLATFFNLSIEVIDEKKEQVGKTFVWHFTVKASHPGGRYSYGVGSCDAYEKAQLRDGVYMRWNKLGKVWEPAQANSLHNIRSTAMTRAVNRAVSDLCGGGEVSAEEVATNGHEEIVNEDEVAEAIEKSRK